VKKLIPIVVSVVACLSSAAFAQEDMRARGDRLCQNDARRLCRAVLSQGDMAILQCFQTNKRRLSVGCAKFLREVGQLQ
jgi:hypothetical protein